MVFPVCLPQGQFAFPRSYVEGIYVRHDVGMLTFTGSLLTFIVAGSPDAVVRVWFDPRFTPWSSNRWTLDFVTIDASYQYPPGAQIRPLPFYVYWVIPPGKGRAHIGIDAWYGSEYTAIPLATQPPGYWLPPPYP